MARTPNYSFERQTRERQKAAKMAEKAEAKRRAKEGQSGPPADAGDDPSDKD